MNQVFDITVVDKDGKKATFRSEVGGGYLTPETLKQHYNERGLFTDVQSFDAVLVEAQPTPAGQLTDAVPVQPEHPKAEAARAAARLKGQVVSAPGPLTPGTGPLPVQGGEKVPTNDSKRVSGGKGADGGAKG